MQRPRPVFSFTINLSSLKPLGHRSEAFSLIQGKSRFNGYQLSRVCSGSSRTQETNRRESFETVKIIDLR